MKEGGIGATSMLRTEAIWVGSKLGCSYLYDGCYFLYRGVD